MSTKYFCDGCKEEITSKNRVVSETNNTRLAITSKQDNVPSFEITIGRRSIWNTGDWCKYCIIDAVNALDDRPKKVYRDDS